MKIETEIQGLRTQTELLIGQLNIDSMRNKFEMLTPLITNKIDVLLLSETEIETFP